MKQQWCLQCGEENKPVVAVGVDEDGEPACNFHATKSNAGRQQETATVGSKKSAAVQPETSKAMATESKGIRPTAPCEFCGREIALRMMNRHVQSKHSAAKHRIPRKAVSVPSVASIATDMSLTELRAKLVRDLEAVDAVIALLGKTG